MYLPQQCSIPAVYSAVGWPSHVEYVTVIKIEDYGLVQPVCDLVMIPGSKSESPLQWAISHLQYILQ